MIIDDTLVIDPRNEMLRDSLTLTLRTPVTFAKTEYAVLELTEPKAGELIAASKAGNALEQGAMLMHLNAKVPMGVIEQLRQRDFEEAADFYAQFSTTRLPSISAAESPASAASTAGAGLKDSA